VDALGAIRIAEKHLGNMADWLTQTVRAAGIERKLKAGQILFRTGQHTTGLYEVTSGTVRLVRVDSAGRETVLYVAASGEMLAEASLFAPAYHCDAIAVTDAVVRRYPKDKVLEEFERNSAVTQAFMAMLAQRVMDLRARLEQRNIHSAHDRLRHYFALHIGADGYTVKVPGTLKDLAAELGLTHEALYRTLADMAAAGEIERLKGQIRLLKPPSLI
jgi:CRP-like cAMP-binding protein